MKHPQTCVVLLLYYFLSTGACYSFIQTDDHKSMEPKNILVLFSLENGSNSYDRMIEQFKNKIRNEYDQPVNFYMDFMGLARLKEENQIKEYFEYYFKKYEKVKIDLFISIGPDMYPYLEKYGNPVLDSVPKIYFEVFSPSSEINYDMKGKNKTSIIVDIEPEKLIKASIELFPETKNIYVITGISVPDIRMLERCKNALKPYEGKNEITYISGVPIKSLQQQLKDVPSNSIIFCILYLRDSLGRTYNNTDAVKLISSNSTVPVIALVDVALESTAGGLMVNTSEMGRKIGEVAVRILYGEKPEDIATFRSNFLDYMFNWKQLKRWNIENTKLPEGSIIINREYSFTETYIDYIIAGALFVILETFILIVLLQLYRKQKKLTIEVKEKEERFRTLVDYNRLSELSGLTASLSHELNQPLAAILSFSQAAQRFLKYGKLEDEVLDEVLVNIIQDVKRAAGIIRGLRSMIKNETREKKRVNINIIAGEVMHLFTGQAAVKDIRIITDYESIDPFVMADSILIQQVILNLLLNASEALEKGVPEIADEIILRTEVNDGIVNVSVSDNGPGINDTLKESIFKPFFTTKPTGLGIGLAVCKSIIEDHGGTIMCENNRSGGSTFSFKLKKVQ